MDTVRRFISKVGLGLTLTVLLAGVGQALEVGHEPGEPITGAGAHFSWVVLDALKSELEERSGRAIKLYGKESMLGAGCNAGIKTARKSRPGHETFGLVCCPLSDEEVRDKGLRVYPLALEPILIITHASNPVTNLDIEQVRAIFRGDITNWEQVGGKDQPIVVVTRLHCKQRPGHWKMILPSHTEFRQQKLNVKSADEVVKRVNDFPGAIGHVGSAWAFESRDEVKAISVNGYSPTADNLRVGNYPFYRTLSMVTSDNPSRELLDLVANVQTLLQGHTVAKKYELVTLEVGAD